MVRKLLADAAAHGAGQRYLIQHSAGSGKSNSIAWLAHQLVGLEGTEAAASSIRSSWSPTGVLDKQIRDTIKQFAQVSRHRRAMPSTRATCASFLEAGKKIIITTVQKFPFILDEIGDEHRGRSFAIIIDEAHSSQGGRTAAAMNTAARRQDAPATAKTAREEETTEDKINRIMEARKMLTNASYFAFTATPKNKTLEIFGEPVPAGDGR